MQNVGFVSQQVEIKIYWDTRISIFHHCIPGKGKDKSVPWGSDFAQCHKTSTCHSNLVIA